MTEIAKNGERAVLLYLVQRSDCDRVTVASDIDPAYARAMQAARAAGVEVLAYRADITPMRITLGPELRVE